MTPKIINLHPETILDITPDKVLQNNIGKLDQVILIGYDKENELYFASSTGDMAEILWLIENCKHKILNQMPD